MRRRALVAGMLISAGAMLATHLSHHAGAGKPTREQTAQRVREQIATGDLRHLADADLVLVRP
jgi:hypothetical protein